MYYVYIIYSKKLNKIYKGFTGNLKERVKRHNLGEVVSTKSGMPWIVVYFTRDLLMRKMREERNYS